MVLIPDTVWAKALLTYGVGYGVVVVVVVVVDSGAGCTVRMTSLVFIPFTIWLKELTYGGVVVVVVVGGSGGGCATMWMMSLSLIRYAIC